MNATTTKRRRQPPAPWQRTTARRPCPVCHRAGCLFTGPQDDPTAVVCANVESAEPIGSRGFLHVLRNGPAWAPWRRSLRRIALQGGTADE